MQNPKAPHWFVKSACLLLLLASSSAFAQDTYYGYINNTHGLNPAARPLQLPTQQQVQQQAQIPVQDAAPQYDAYGFQSWLSGFKQRALSQGLNPQFLDRTLASLEFKPRVIELDGKQPENKIMFAQYRTNIVSAKRIADGRARLAENRAALRHAAQTYGVPAQYIVALWGIETNYGRNTGGFNILSSLATLAYEGRRAAFFEKELLTALTILANGHTGTNQLIGSWAGAMGQCQFMPTSYMKYAVDGDGDGNIDIWNSLPDVFASIANYLKTEGWNKDLRWGREVDTPRNIPADAYGRDKMQPLSAWKRAGVKDTSGRAIQMPADGSDPMAALVAPDGPGTPTFLVYKNYNVIMHWNRSTYFATSVGLLADAIGSQP